MEGEDQRAQDERVKRLWQTLDTQNEGKLSLHGLRRGLHKLDHREPGYTVGEICALILL